MITASLRPRRVLSACAGPLLRAVAGAAAPAPHLARVRIGASVLRGSPASVPWTLGGKFRLDEPALLYAGLAALLAATAWGVLRRGPSPARACGTGACAGSGRRGSRWRW